MAGHPNAHRVLIDHTQGPFHKNIVNFHVDVFEFLKYLMDFDTFSLNKCGLNVSHVSKSSLYQ